MTSSSLPSRPTCGPAPRCLPLPDRFSGHQLPNSTQSPRGVAGPSAFLLPHKLGSWRHTQPRGHVPLLRQAAATAWPGVSLFSPRLLRGPSNAALPNIAFLKPSPLFLLSFPSPFTLISPASSSNSAITLILAPEALNWPLPPTHLGPKETLPESNSYYTGHNFCFYSPWPHHPGHCSTGRFLHGHRKRSPSPTLPKETLWGGARSPGAPVARLHPHPHPTLPAQQGFMRLPRPQGHIKEADSRGISLPFIWLRGTLSPERRAELGEAGWDRSSRRGDGGCRGRLRSPRPEEGRKKSRQSVWKIPGGGGGRISAEGASLPGAAARDSPGGGSAA